MGASETLDVLTQDVLQRGGRAPSGDPVFSRAVRMEVRDCRRSAMAETISESCDHFSIKQVNEVLDHMVANRRSMHLPRGAVKAKLAIARQLVWAVVNLATVFGLVASTWAREISPLRKAGPEIVTDPINLRPVGYMGDLAGVFDALWLASVKEALDAYSGPLQAGGKHDAVLMVLGILMVLQIRFHQGLATLLEKVDLLHGFDLAWRDAVRLHLARAGVRGRAWLVADASMDDDPLRVRIGPLIGEMVKLRDVGIGQGRQGSSASVWLLAPILDG